MMVDYDFSGSVVLVTGAGRGQGRSHAVKFASHGADVIVTDVIPENIEESVNLVKDQGGDALGLEMDVSQEAEVEAGVEAAVEEFDAVDVLINNAGIWNHVDPTEMTEDAWDGVIDTNLKGVWLCAKHVCSHMIDHGNGGKVVNISSIGGLVGLPRFTHYTASKHGVVGVTRSLAVDLAEHGINVNAVCPGMVDVPVDPDEVSDGAIPDFVDLAGTFNLLDPGTPLDPIDISEICLWLASDAARYVTGTAIPVDGGFTVK
jgi:NAD(P)-dependent dehydrogenase (short-subunit alcohol dehydrogenase family)